MLLAAFLREGAAALESLYPSPEAGGMVSILCRERLGVQSYTHIVEPSTEIPSDALPALQDDLSRLLKGEPLQYALGYADFCGRRFKVGPGVLVPRPETEMLVSEVEGRARGLNRPARILDLCTGSGCIAWSLALDLPGSQVTAVDISGEALAIARTQFESAQGPRFLQADVLGSVPEWARGYDFLTANPPYIMEGEKPSMRSNVLDWEPGLALFVPDSDPLVFCRALAAWADRCLVPGGRGIIEINEALGAESFAIFAGAKFEKIEILSDFFGKNRFVSFQKSLL